MLLVVVGGLHPVCGASRVGYAGFVEGRLHGGTYAEGGVSRVHAGRVGGESGCAVEGAVQVELCLAEPLVYGCRRMHPSVCVHRPGSRFGHGGSAVQSVLEYELVGTVYAKPDVTLVEEGEGGYDRTPRAAGVEVPEPVLSTVRGIDYSPIHGRSLYPWLDA